MKIFAPIEIADETIAYVLDSGSDYICQDYWAQIEEWQPIESVLAGEASIIVRECGDDCAPGEDEPDTRPLHTLDRAAIERGIAYLAQHCPASFTRILDGDFDCLDGDLLIQAALLGEIRYG